MFSSSPTQQEIFQARVFQEPLVPIGSDPEPAETAALATALVAYSRRSAPDDYSSLSAFLAAHPNSCWNAALLTDLGLEFYSTGYYSKALDAWRQAWHLAKVSTDLRGKPLADRAVGELAYMLARIGEQVELDALLKSIEGRPLCGPATERISGAREGLWNMRNRPQISFRCGPLALHRIKLTVDPANPQTELIDASESSACGLSLQQVAALSQTVGLDQQIAFRNAGAEFVTPAVVHFKVGHFAALIRCEGDHYLVQDPTFKNDAWVTSAALAAEASGYFLIPAGVLPRGWRAVESAEAETIWGKGNVPNPPTPPNPCDPSTDACSSCPSQGMATSRVMLLNVSLNLSDEPVGYTPPVGPAVHFVVRYNQRDNQFSSTFNYSNFGPKWTFDWLAYIIDSPANSLADVTYYMAGGGNRTYTGFNSVTSEYSHQLLDQTKLSRNADGSYELLLRNGTRFVFARSDGGLATRRWFLSRLVDPRGNAVTLQYDSKFRIISITDAIGQVTTLAYENAADVFKITKVTDPFGRFAVFGYNASGQLTSITDVIGIVSSFAYDSTTSDFVTTLTTPYGVTSFTKLESGSTRALEILYPDGERERVEFNQDTTLGIPASDPPQSIPSGMNTRNVYLAFRNTYHWDRQACAYAYGDHSKARIYHWLHSTDLQSPVGIFESVKQPLEGRVWYDYAGQVGINGSIVVGSFGKPTHVGRVLDDGSTQLYTYEYNAFGNVTKGIDPVGRTRSYVYSDDGLDLLEVRQTRAGQNELLAQETYNIQHLPLTTRDAAGQVTTYTYNVRGQLLTETNARGDKTTYHYDANGYRTSVDGPLGSGDTTTWTYDPPGRARTKTDVSGYALAFEYDDLDRLTKITYPDATFDQLSYTLLDQTLVRDRAGRKTSFEYNKVRQMTKRTDPFNRATLFQWCKCGALRCLTDPMGRTTTWRHDVQGREKSKEYADGSKITYLYEATTSRMRQRIDEKLQVTQYSYNRDNTKSYISYTNANVATPAVAFTYDANHRRLTSMVDGTGTTQYDYIPITPIPTLGAGQPLSVDGPLPNDTIVYGYDELGRRVSTSINGVASTVTADAAGRVTSATNALGKFDYAYDGSSFRQTSQSYPNGQTAERSYSGILQDLRLQRITHRNGSTPISEFIYGHDVPTGQITAWSQQAGTQLPSIYSLAYDPVDQLISASVSTGGIVGQTFGYSYDPASNRLTEQVDATIRQFSYNALNQLTSIEGDASPAATYQWDAEHRLISVSSGNQTTQFTYDGLGRRVGIRQSVDNSEVSNRWFVWCDDEICEERTVNNSVSKRFFQQGIQLNGGPSASNFFYTRDHLGSIVELTDAAGKIRARYACDPVGRRRRVEGDLDADFGFAGMLWAPEVRLNLTKFRAYDPNIGRWLSRDPLSAAERIQGPNLYTYAVNDPVNRIDPLGLECDDEAIELAAAVIAAILACSSAGADAGLSGPLCAGAIVAMVAAIKNLKACQKKPDHPNPNPCRRNWLGGPDPFPV